MKHVKTLSSNTLKNSMKKGGCGECQTSCQSACKTSCTDRKGQVRKKSGDHQIVTVTGKRRNSHLKIKTVGES